MVNRWVSVAVILAGLAASARAQNPFLMNQAKPSVMPEPVAFSQSPMFGANPPVASAAYPAAAFAGGQPAPGVPGPGCVPGLPSEENGHSLNGDTANAWNQENCLDPGNIYVSLGGRTMTRQRLSHLPTTFLDTASGGADTGDPIPANAPIFSRLSDIAIRNNYGAQATIGYHWGTSAIELSGFYLWLNDSAKMLAGPTGQLDAPFVNPPLGFEGDAGMWLQDDIIRTSLRTALGSAELNYRWWLGTDSSFSWSLGVRYLDLYERFRFYAGDDDLTVFDLNGNPDPTRQATYSVKAHNRLIAPQLGLEWNREITCWLAFTLTAKGAWGGNLVDVDTLLQRGDGFVGFATHREQWIFSQLYETGFFLNLKLMDNCRLRAGYNLLWVVDIDTATGQLDYNLANPGGRNNNGGSVLYYGPSFEFSVLF
jgi:hypothetical protein